MHLDVCYYVGNLCASRIGLSWAHNEFFFARHMLMHTYLFFSYWYSLWLVLFCLFLSLSPSLSNSLRMAPKRKSASSWNPLHSKASSSDPTSLSVQFRDEKAHQYFLENFSRRGIHSECRVILSDFSDIALPIVIHSWGWESLCEIPVSCHINQSINQSIYIRVMLTSALRALANNPF